LGRFETVEEILKDGEWLTAQMLNARQPGPASDFATEWKRSRRIFSVPFAGEDYLPRYQSDAFYMPVPVISKVLEAFGPNADTWKIAAWLHYPNAWIVESGPVGVRTVAPKDVLDRPVDVLNAPRAAHGELLWVTCISA